MSLSAGRGCRWPPRRDSVSPCAPLSGGGRDTHDGHENSPILVFFSNLLDLNQFVRIGRGGDVIGLDAAIRRSLRRASESRLRRAAIR